MHACWLRCIREVRLHSDACCSSQQTIETLDERGGISRHHMWPPPPPAPAEPEAAEDDGQTVEQPPHPWELLPAQQRLVDVLQYLRDRHVYCLFCGAQVRDFILLCDIVG